MVKCVFLRPEENEATCPPDVANFSLLDPLFTSLCMGHSGLHHYCLPQPQRLKLRAAGGLSWMTQANNQFTVWYTLCAV